MVVIIIITIIKFVRIFQSETTNCGLFNCRRGNEPETILFISKWKSNPPSGPEPQPNPDFRSHQTSEIAAETLPLCLVIRGCPVRYESEEFSGHIHNFHVDLALLGGPAVVRVCRPHGCILVFKVFGGELLCQGGSRGFKVQLPTVAGDQCYLLQLWAVLMLWLIVVRCFLVSISLIINLFSSFFLYTNVPDELLHVSWCQDEEQPMMHTQQRRLSCTRSGIKQSSFFPLLFLTVLLFLVSLWCMTWKEHFFHCWLTVSLPWCS